MSKKIYDIDGNIIYDGSIKSTFQNAISYRYKKENGFYIETFIPQMDSNGNKQYPFVLWSNYPRGGNKSAYEISIDKDLAFCINGGTFQAPFGPNVTITGLPSGTVIQNGVVLQQATVDNTSSVQRVLTIDTDGKLDYADRLTNAQSLINNGVISALTGFCPIIYDFENIEEHDDTITYPQSSAGYVDAQRQLIAQYPNGDYAVITSEGRGFVGTGFNTVPQLQDICKSLGIKFAFLLDGGGSTETVIGKKQLNPMYDNIYGRRVPTYIIFNGTTNFQ